MNTRSSDPAATAYYGAKSTAAKLTMVVDIGGTATDIKIIKSGNPLISNKGSLIDCWQTHIDAVDMHAMDMPDTMLGNQAFKKRFIGNNNGVISRHASPLLSSQGSKNNPEVAAPPEEFEGIRGKAPRERTILEILRNPDLFRGQRVVVTGMILRDFDHQQINGKRVPLVLKPRIKPVEAPAIPHLF